MAGYSYRVWLLVSLTTSALLSPSVQAQGAAATGTQSVMSDASWKALDPCAQNCFQSWFLGCWMPILDSALGCATQQCTLADNDCLCRTDHQPVATSFISSCVSASCTIGDAQIDVSSGVAVYQGYCGDVGYPIVVVATSTNPGTVTLEPTSANPSLTASNPVQTGNALGLVVTSAGGNGGGTTSSGNVGNSGLSVGDLGGIVSAVVGTLAVIIALFAMTQEQRASMFRCCCCCFGY